MWARAGLPKPDRHVVDRRYQQTLYDIYGYSAQVRDASKIRADRLKKPARLRELLRLLDSPQSRIPCILVAGTKGKGSTAAMIAGILTAAGHRVGRYTQPHLVSWRERTWVSGSYLSVKDTVRLYPRIRAAARELARAFPELGAPTTFEIGTALSLVRFAEAGADVAVVEVGVGGRYDATNALDPIVSVITPVSFDHADVIGPTISDIAHEKSGVMRPDRPVIIGRQPADAARVIASEADRLGARCSWIGRDWVWRPCSSAPDAGELPAFEIRGSTLTLGALRLPLLGDFQRENACAAVGAVQASGLIETSRLERAVRDGLEQVHWPGRLHVVSNRPVLVLDGAHNADSARQLVAAIKTSFAAKPTRWVIGLSRGKDLHGFLEAIEHSATQVIATEASHERSIPAEELASLVREAFSSHGCSISVVANASPAGAVVDALRSSSPDDVVCVAGSFFLLGDLYSELNYPEEAATAP